MQSMYEACGLLTCVNNNLTYGEQSCFSSKSFSQKRKKGRSQIPSHKFQGNIIFVPRMSQNMGKRQWQVPLLPTL